MVKGVGSHLPNHQVAWRKPAAHGELLWGRPWRRAKGKHAKGNQNRFCANSPSEVRCRALVTFWYAVLVATTSCDSFWPTHPGSGQKNNHEHGVYMEYIYICACVVCVSHCTQRLRVLAGNMGSLCSLFHCRMGNPFVQISGSGSVIKGMSPLS